MGKSKVKLVAITTNSNGECVSIANVKNVDENELKVLYQQYEKALNEKQVLETKVKLLEREIVEIKQEIKVLKGEE